MYPYINFVPGSAHICAQGEAAKEEGQTLKGQNKYLVINMNFKENKIFSVKEIFCIDFF